MVNRRLKTDEELAEDFRRSPHLERLYHDLRKVDGITVQADGAKGSSCIFKVYVTDHMARFESFLWVHHPQRVGSTSVAAYVQWRQSPEPVILKRIWRDVINKKPADDKDDGRYLRAGVESKEVLARVVLYIEELRLATSRK